MSRRFLKQIRIDSYGAFAGKTVGPFAPGMNVVYGANEAGKSTLASFVGGVLFGWEEARGARNTYKPAAAERAGALFFAQEDDPEGKEWEVSRARNADGLKGDASVVEDIDRETFATMFSLSSDELRSLKNTSDVTARLLTAGSGTASSPAEAFVELEQRIASYTSRAAGATHSIVRLEEQLKKKREELRQASEQAELYKREDRELRELRETRGAAAMRLDELNADIENMSGWRSRLERVEQHRGQVTEQLAALRRESARASIPALEESTVPAELLDLDAAADRALRDRLDDLAGDLAKATHAVDVASEHATTSEAAYEALCELDGPSQTRYRKGNRTLQVAVAVLLTVVFVAGGLPLFVHGREVDSLSFTLLGGCLVAAALLLAILTIVLVFRPNRAPDAFQARRDDAQWVMLQDRKKLDACMVSLSQVQEDIQVYLDRAGLSCANGSLKQARTILDDARDERARREMARQRATSLNLRMSALQDELQNLEAERAQIAVASDLPDPVTAASLGEAVAQRMRQRDSLLESYEAMNLRYGELDQQLSQARLARSFDELKMECAQIKTRLTNSKRQLAVLLLARHMLEASISSWESRSQPEVYREASRMMSLITDGAWVRVEMTSEGVLAVTDAQHNVREPRHLSLGTCQQLYLALRIALLENAQNVGRCIPVLADDILVNFDAVRRAGAARALAELSRTRQVIMFTCHPEVVDSVRAADANCNYIAL